MIENISVSGYTSLGAALPLKNYMMGKVSKKKKNIVSVNFICALFSLLNFLMYEDGVNRLS